MKKVIIKGSIVVIVFFAALFITSGIMNKGNTDMTMEMGKASFPVMWVNYGGYRINEMHGYETAMDLSQMRESITPLASGRKVSLEINPYGEQISQIAFEVRSLEGSRLIENTVIEEFEQDEDKIKVTFAPKDLIESDQEYALVILLTLGNGKEIRYYTRIVSTEKYFSVDKLEYVNDFSNKTFDKEAARDLTKYLESNEEGDNTTYAKVTIHSSFNQITWGNLDITRETRANITIKELAPQTGSFILDYYVSTPDGKDKTYYRVKEYFRVRHTEERMYLLDYERTMDQIFNAAEDVYTNNKIMLGIISEDVQLLESDGGNVFAFTVGNRLYSYNVVDNKMALLFGFYNAENQDARTLYDGNRITILNADEGGNVTFLVYGYMNRGRHEGQVGISVYYYDSTVNTVEEMVYISTNKSQSILIKEVEQLSCINRNGLLFLKWEDKIYQINVSDRTYDVVVEDLVEGSYKVSDSNKMAVWQQGGSLYQGNELVLMNLTSGSKKSIKVGMNEVLAPIGFMGEDLIYGIARKSDIVLDTAGNTIFPMYCVKIENEAEGILMTYQQDNVYVVDGEVQSNQIILSRVEKDGEGAYVPIRDDQIMNSETEVDKKNTIDVAATENFEKLTQIALKGQIDTATMMYLTPKEVLFEGARNITFASDVDLVRRYYVYGQRGVEAIYTNEAHAVALADKISGTVVNEDGYYVWMKGNRSLRNQIMKIQGEMATDDKSSMAVCLDIMMEFEGVVRNSKYMLERGSSALSILRESLTEVQVLDLTGCSMDAMLYYVNQDIPVLVTMKDGSAVLLIGFNEKNTVVMNPETGTVYKVGMNDSKEWFEANGNSFITYVRNNK